MTGNVVRFYLQAYVMEKLFPILTISTCGTSLGMSWWCERANRNTSYSCESVGNNPPVEQHRIGTFMLHAVEAKQVTRDNTHGSYAPARHSHLY